jgi:hypothetical protein
MTSPSAGSNDEESAIALTYYRAKELLEKRQQRN